VAALLTLAVLLMVGYTGVSIYIAMRIKVQRMPMDTTSAALGLQYQNVTFPSRYDNVQLKGWFIPGVLPNGQLTTQRAIIMVHGDSSNRVDPAAGILSLSADLARHGFAVLTFDMRVNSESSAAPRSLGYFEQRDVLGAVDYLRSGPLPYPDLGRPHAIGGWGESLGGSTLILATANEPAIQAIVSDSAFADALPRLERDVHAADMPVIGHMPTMFTPGGLIAAQVLYGLDYYHTKPVDVIASIAPRPMFLIQGSADNSTHRDTPPTNLFILAAAAVSAPDANVQIWFVPGATHAQSYHVEGQAYVDRIVAFYTATLGPNTSGS
jgi:cephalosporin-C deacetylase-like acetyl esterase